VKRNKATLYCFSPPVMIATFVIEIGMAAYAVWRYKMGEISRLVVMLLVLLAAFQLAEFMVCRGVSESVAWSRAGFAAIAMMPPVGIHLVYALTKTRNRKILPMAYGAATAFVGFFAFASSSMNGYACTGNYVIFQVAPFASWLFGLYYYTGLITTLLLGWRYIRTSNNQRASQAVTGVMVGYSAFIIPTITAYMLSPNMVGGIPSVMCGFAVILALLLGFKVLPNAAQKRHI